MRVRADDAGDAAVKEVAQRLLFARRLGVKIDEDYIRTGLQSARRDFVVDGAERAIELGHEDAAHRIDDEHICAIFRAQQRRAFARRARRKIERADQPVMPVDVDECLFLIESVIAERYAIGTRINQIVEDRFGDAETTSRVLTVDDHEIEPVLGNQFRQRFADSGPPGAADDIAKKQQSHSKSF